MGDELQAALRRLQVEQGSDARCSATLRSLVVTGSGFFGGSRAAMRELTRLAGITYSGDLVHGYTTHVVVAPAQHAQRAGSSRKLAKAAQWGVPCLRLAWLLDSIRAGSAQPQQPYLLDARLVREPAEQAAAAGEQAGSCRQLPCRQRPSSVASNALDAAAAAGAQAQASAAPAGSVQDASPSPQPWQPSARAALSPVDNLLLQLERMSVSPEPPAGTQPCSAAGPCDIAPHQLSQPSSPQQSLSLQGLVAGWARQGSAGAPELSSACAAGETWHCSTQAGGR